VIAARKVPVRKTTYMVPYSTGRARFQIEPDKVLGYIL
jgi:hypothetical protein